MSERKSRWCVVLPCGDNELWAVPQACLGEIVTLTPDGDTPPTEVEWRGVSVPVLDVARQHEAPWRDERIGTGMIAVILGLQGDDCPYWGVALRGSGLSQQQFFDDEMEDAPELMADHATAAFRVGDKLYQVPDLSGLQQLVFAERSAA